MLSRRDIWHGIGACAIAAVATATFSAGTRAQANYPDRPVRIILPYGPGGVADVSTRLVAAKLSERMGQNFFIDDPARSRRHRRRQSRAEPARGWLHHVPCRQRRRDQ